MIDTKKIDAHMEGALESATVGRLQQLLRSRRGLWLLAAISFFESSLPVPIITDPFMVAVQLANRQNSLVVILVTILSSLAGGIAAFAMAVFFFDMISAYMTAGMQADFQSVVSFAATDTFLTTITGAITPIPYTITAWVVAVAGGSIWLFLLASTIGRSIRYGVVGCCVYLFGPTALRYARRSLTVTSVVVFALLAVYVWLKL